MDPTILSSGILPDGHRTITEIVRLPDDVERISALVRLLNYVLKSTLDLESSRKSVWDLVNDAWPRFELPYRHLVLRALALRNRVEHEHPKEVPYEPCPSSYDKKEAVAYLFRAIDHLLSAIPANGPLGSEFVRKILGGDPHIGNGWEFCGLPEQREELLELLESWGCALHETHREGYYVVTFLTAAHPKRIPDDEAAEIYGRVSKAVDEQITRVLGSTSTYDLFVPYWVQMELFQKECESLAANGITNAPKELRTIFKIERDGRTYEAQVLAQQADKRWLAGGNIRK